MHPQAVDSTSLRNGQNSLEWTKYELLQNKGGCGRAQHGKQSQDRLAQNGHKFQNLEGLTQPKMTEQPKLGSAYEFGGAWKGPQQNCGHKLIGQRLLLNPARAREKCIGNQHLLAVSRQLNTTPKGIETVSLSSGMLSMETYEANQQDPGMRIYLLPISASNVLQDLTLTLDIARSLRKFAFSFSVLYSGLTSLSSRPCSQSRSQ